MKLLAYAVVRAAGELPQALPRGVAGATVEVVAEGALGAAVSALPKLPERSGLAPLLEYRDVVEALAAHRALVPVRYGAVFDGKEEVRALLRRQRGRLEELLDQVEGHVELAVLVTVPARRAEAKRGPAQAGREDAEGGTGRSYLAARRTHYAAKDEASEGSRRLLERCRRAFEGLSARASVDARLRPVASGPGREPRQLASVSFLVPKGKIAVFQERFHALAAVEEAELTLAGPRAPYSFASLGPEEGARGPGSAGGE